MKTKNLFIIACLLLCSVAKAQNQQTSRWRFGIGLETGVPTNFNHNRPLLSNSKFELGGTARLQYSINKSAAFTLTSGYYNLFLSPRPMNSPEFNPYGNWYAGDQGIIPVKGGLKLFIKDGFYVMGEAGAGFETRYFKDTKLILSPGVGFATRKWDFGLRYENFSGQRNNYGLVGLRVAYGFGL